MARLHRVTFGKDSFLARSGQVLLEAALTSGVEMPHDCRAGRCGACITRVRAGITLGGQSPQPGMVHACQAMVFSDLDLEHEELPPTVTTQARIVGIASLTAGIVEVVIEPATALDIWPGQYCRFRFRGFPDRPFSPTTAMTTLDASGLIHLQVKQVRGGRVTPLLGSTIARGHAVAIEGPMGHAFLRPGLSNRLVLVASGTGFAPVWAVASAALRENPSRPIVLIGASRTVAGCYMAPALDLAAGHRNVAAILCIDELDAAIGALMPGSPIDHLPPLTGADLVYAAGGPGLVDAVGGVAQAAGATFYADPFASSAPRAASWIDVAKSWLQAG